MKQSQLYRGVLAIVIGALGLWKGLSAADVTPVDRREAVAIRGESDAVLAFIPLPDIKPMKSCVGKNAKPPCNSQQGIFQTCKGDCPNGDMCVIPVGNCFYCHTVAGTEIKSCMKSAVFKCYSGTGNAVVCGPRTVGTTCTSFATVCLTGSSCSHTCKDTKVLMGNCPDLNDACTGNAP